MYGEIDKGLFDKINDYTRFLFTHWLISNELKDLIRSIFDLCHLANVYQYDWVFLYDLEILCKRIYAKQYDRFFRRIVKQKIDGKEQQQLMN